LNSAIFNVARIVGPAVGGIMLATMGAAWCFGLNGLSFLAVLLALLAMRFPDSQPTAPHESMSSQITAGLGYVMGKPSVRTMMLLVGISQLFGFWYTILLPAYASGVLHVGEAGLGTLNAATGVGALLGSLVVASVTRVYHRKLLLTTGSLLFPVAILFFAVSKWLSLSMLSLALAGVGFVAQNSTANTLIQLDLPDQLRGRVMAVFLLLFFGTTPFTSLMAGGVGQALGVRAAVAIGAGVTLLVATGLLLTVPSLRRTEVEAEPEGMA
jgi:predicted MFS family arabinose efflux permease